MGIGAPLCSPIMLDATVPESPTTLRTTRLMPQPCIHFSKIAVITERMTKCLLKIGNKTVNINAKNCSLYTLLMATDRKQQK